MSVVSIGGSGATVAADPVLGAILIAVAVVLFAAAILTKRVAIFGLLGLVVVFVGMVELSGVLPLLSGA